MKLFVTGKAGEESVARSAMQSLKRAGHEITFDWTSIPHLKPYTENVAASRKTAVLETQGVMDAEAVVLLAHEKGIGMYVELGMAIAWRKPVFVIGDMTPTMFLFHPLVKRVKDVTEVMDHLDKLKDEKQNSRSSLL
jgi:hypothetical protein